MDLLVTPEWLARQSGLTILDATYYALEPERNARADFEAGHIPGALFLDLEHLADKGSPWPSMAPPVEQFAERLRALGVRQNDRIILYDQAPHHTSARAWWLFRLFGFPNVSLLDGGVPRWRAEGRPVATGSVTEPGGGNVEPRLDPFFVRDVDQMRGLVASNGTQIVDARSAARFSGAEGDPRPGVAAGHIPGALNLPYGKLFEADGTWKSPEGLAAAFRTAGVDVEGPVTATCGSGITASVLLFGLALLGNEDGALYDGSWSEWGALPDTPKATGA